MTTDLWILLSLAVLTELLTLPPLVARGSVPGALSGSSTTEIRSSRVSRSVGSVPVRPHANLADNLAIYAAVIGLAHLTGSTNGTTAIAGIVLLSARVLHAMIYIAGIPLSSYRSIAVAQLSMLVYVWQIIVHFSAH